MSSCEIRTSPTCLLGVGANPLLSRDQHATSIERYWLLDLSNEEFAKASDGYEQNVAYIASDDPLPAKFLDLVFPRILATHTYDDENSPKRAANLAARGTCGSPISSPLHTSLCY